MKKCLNEINYSEVITIQVTKNLNEKNIKQSYDVHSKNEWRQFLQHQNTDYVFLLNTHCL